MAAEILILDSITKVPAKAGHAVAYCASHGGRFSGMLALRSGLRSVILCDAGVGLRQAGIASLAMLESFGVPAATIGHRTARIGSGQDGYARGLISYVNPSAAALGVCVGDSCRQALEQLAKGTPPASMPDTSLLAVAEHRNTIVLPEAGRVVLADSNSLITQADAGQIIVCGSHGGLLGDDPLSAVRFDVGAIVFNDADRGADNAGLSRLPALDQRGIPAACVSAWTACIGDSQSSYETGVISALNDTAVMHGGVLGMATQEFVLRLLANGPVAKAGT
ncbi:hypothetical protein RE432_06485 [Pusillimonas sp. SM2304]|uniref:hypothetical protein n=1 Tax=Pusillimonas sp. SM2304 TaxID=3073241 RepID=UPI002874597B|nr:hypothetical protein [Pusillimonas sp. SM2304]MDS1140077.1 hypothetical protein [Pusillimonas sp. SM2304]